MAGGAVLEIKIDEVLGAGSYGKVCKAKYGQLPCAAKLLHETMFRTGDPGMQRFAERFQEECQFLSVIRHPNVVQFLGTWQDPHSFRLALIMELMDESLTGFLKRYPGPLPLHVQINICYDVALALSYLHANALIHRDLSSNNVLLMNEGSRAKVTDFGMAKLMDMRPQIMMTLCPGTNVYMPPEALTSPPHYTVQLDCFSYGVLTLQIVTRNIPDPGVAQRAIKDPKYPSGSVFIQIPEIERRQQDISLVKQDHPLLRVILRCLNNTDTKRPLADKICQDLVAMKNGRQYSLSIKQNDQASLLQKLHEECQRYRGEIQNIRETHAKEVSQMNQLVQNELSQRNLTFQSEMDTKLRDKAFEIERLKAEQRMELQVLRSELSQKDQLIQRERKDHIAKLEGNNKLITDSERVKELHQKEISGISEALQLEIHHKDRTIKSERAHHAAKLAEKDQLIQDGRANHQELFRKYQLVKKEKENLTKELEQKDQRCRSEDHRLKVLQQELAEKEQLLQTERKGFVERDRNRLKEVQRFKGDQEVLHNELAQKKEQIRNEKAERDVLFQKFKSSIQQLKADHHKELIQNETRFTDEIAQMEQHLQSEKSKVRSCQKEIHHFQDALRRERTNFDLEVAEKDKLHDSLIQQMEADHKKELIQRDSQHKEQLLSKENEEKQQKKAAQEEIQHLRDELAQKNELIHKDRANFDLEKDKLLQKYKSSIQQMQTDHHEESTLKAAHFTDEIARMEQRLQSEESKVKSFQKEIQQFQDKIQRERTNFNLEVAKKDKLRDSLIQQMEANHQKELILRDSNHKEQLLSKENEETQRKKAAQEEIQRLYDELAQKNELIQREMANFNLEKDQLLQKYKSSIEQIKKDHHIELTQKEAHFTDEIAQMEQLLQTEQSKVKSFQKQIQQFQDKIQRERTNFELGVAKKDEVHNTLIQQMEADHQKELIQRDSHHKEQLLFNENEENQRNKAAQERIQRLHDQLAQKNELIEKERANFNIEIAKTDKLHESVIQQMNADHHKELTELKKQLLFQKQAELQKCKEQYQCLQNKLIRTVAERHQEQKLYIQQLKADHQTESAGREERQKLAAEHLTEVKIFQNELAQKDELIETERAIRNIEVTERDQLLQEMKTQLHEIEVAHQKELSEINQRIQNERADHQTELTQKAAEIRKLVDDLHKEKAAHYATQSGAMRANAEVGHQPRAQVQEETKPVSKIKSAEALLTAGLNKVLGLTSSTKIASSESHSENEQLQLEEVNTDSVALKWQEGETAPQHFQSTDGLAITHGRIAYFSYGHFIYSFSSQDCKWAKSQISCRFKDFGMAIVNGKLTTIGGYEDSQNTLTNVLLTVVSGVLRGKTWKEFYPPMPTKRNMPAAVATCSNLVVAGGWKGYHDGLSDVEVLNLDTRQWYVAKHLPEMASNPQMAMCGQLMYISHRNKVYSCFFEELLKSCFTPNTGYMNVWTRLPDTQLYNVSMVSLEGCLLAIGGSDEQNRVAGSSVCLYNKSRNQWNAIGQVPSPVSRVLCTVLANNKVIIAGGRLQHNIGSNQTFIGTLLDNSMLLV